MKDNKTKKPTASKFHAFSELLALFDQRHKELGLRKPDYPAYRKPVFNDAGLDRMQKAARDYGQAHPSDPFSAKRAAHSMRQGYELVSDIQADATRILQAAEAARRARFALLEAA